MQPAHLRDSANLWIFTGIWTALSQASSFKSSYFRFVLFCSLQIFSSLRPSHETHIPSCQCWFLCPCLSFFFFFSFPSSNFNMSPGLSLKISSATANKPLCISDASIWIKKPSDLVLKTEQRALEDTWRWVLDTYLNSNLEYRKSKQILNIFSAFTIKLLWACCNV